MKISIILAIYNEEKTLKKCLNTLVSQQINAEFEIIIVDDGSKIDVSTLNWDELKSPKIQTYRLTHQGPALARNFGVTKAKGEILVFLDGDMYFEPDFIKILTAPISMGKVKGTYSTQEYTANWENIWARCWSWENGQQTRLRINPAKNANRDFRAILKTEFQRVKGFENVGYTDSWTLYTKLNYYPNGVKAKYYHFNPDTLLEVYHQAKWIGGRIRKGGFVGRALALIRASLPVSTVFGVIKAARHLAPAMLIFKIVYDFGIFQGIISSTIKK